MQLHTEASVARAQPRAPLNTSIRQPARARTAGLRPEPDGLSAAELRRIVADLLG